MPSPVHVEYRTAGWIALALVLAAGVMLWPFGPWVLLATWLAVSARRLHRPLTRVLGGRPRAAAVLTIVSVALVVVPVVILVTSLVVDAIDLVDRLMASDRAQEVLRRLASGDDPAGDGATDLVGLVLRQGERAWGIAQEIAGTAANMVIGILILVAGTYAMLVEGDRWYVWIERHAPVSPAVLRRFADAFVETGHGLFVGIAGAGLAQAIVATIIYVVLGVPQPYALGLLTLLFSVIPAVGTAMVWIPIALGLALTGRPGAAIILGVAGVVVIGTIDNLVRPILARRGHLQLPSYVVLIAMFGGIEVMGGWGLLVAPLVVRLAKEALLILREARDLREAPAVRGTPDERERTPLAEG